MNESINVYEFYIFNFSETEAASDLEFNFKLVTKAGIPCKLAFEYKLVGEDEPIRCNVIERMGKERSLKGESSPSIVMSLSDTQTAGCLNE